MLKEVVASKAAKLIAACVCPVAGTTAITVSVPEVREAVHRATAPAKAKAKPKGARKPAQARAVAVCPQPADTPVILSSRPLAGASILPPFQPTELAALAPEEVALPFPPHFHRLPEGPLAFLIPPAPIGGVPPGPGPGPGPAPPIPEPEVWIQLLLGFGVVGGMTRSAYRLRHREEAEASTLG